MKLIELEPHWVGLLPGHALGITFLCPHCKTTRLGIAFDVPIGAELTKGYIGMQVDAHHFDIPLWHRDGDTFETLTLTPSVDASAHQHWHGWIKNGEIV